MPILVADGIQIGMGNEAGRTRVIDQDVQASEATLGFSHHGAAGVILRDVGAKCDRIDSRLIRQFRDTLGRLAGAAVVDENRTARGGQPQDGGAPHARSPTGDDCCLVVELHISSSLKILADLLSRPPRSRSSNSSSALL